MTLGTLCQKTLPWNLVLCTVGCLPTIYTHWMRKHPPPSGYNQKCLPTLPTSPKGLNVLVENAAPTPFLCTLQVGEQACGAELAQGSAAPEGRSPTFLGTHKSSARPVTQCRWWPSSPWALRLCWARGRRRIPRSSPGVADKHPISLTLRLHHSLVLLSFPSWDPFSNKLCQPSPFSQDPLSREPRNWVPFFVYLLRSEFLVPKNSGPEKRTDHCVCPLPGVTWSALVWHRRCTWPLFIWMLWVLSTTDALLNFF